MHNCTNWVSIVIALKTSKNYDQTGSQIKVVYKLNGSIHDYHSIFYCNDLFDNLPIPIKYGKYKKLKFFYNEQKLHVSLAY